jgi:hypothetical protein
MTDESTGTLSPRLTARMAGLFYLLMSVFGEAANLARRGLIVSGDATATAVNIQAHQSLYLLGYAGDILMVASYVVVTALLYRVFKPVNKTVALIAAAAGLMGCAILAIAYSYELAPLDSPRRRTISGSVHDGTASGAVVSVPAILFAKLRRVPRILRLLPSADRLAHCQVDLFCRALWACS